MYLKLLPLLYANVVGLCVLAFSASWFSQRDYPGAGVFFIALLLVSLAPLGIPSKLRLNRQAAIILGTMAISCGYQATVNIAQSCPTTAWTNYILSLGTVFIPLALLSDKVTKASVIHTFSISTLVAYLASFSYGKYIGADDFGLGNINYLTNLVVPACFLALYPSSDHTKKSNYLRIGFVAITVAVLLFQCLDTGRRGPRIAALFAATIIPAALLSKRLALTYFCTIAILGLATLIYILSLPFYLDDRLLLYKAMFHLGIENGPWGAGTFGAHHSQTSDHALSRTLTAQGHWPIHAHNEALDVFVNGGYIGALLFFIKLSLLTAATMAHSSTLSRIALIGAWSALFVHAMSDNTLGTPCGLLFLSVMIGITIMTEQNKEDEERSQTTRVYTLECGTWPRPLLFLALLAYALLTIPDVVIARDADISKQSRVLKGTRLNWSSEAYMRPVIMHHIEQRNYSEATSWINLVERKIGKCSNTSSLRAVLIAHRFSTTDSTDPARAKLALDLVRTYMSSIRQHPFLVEAYRDVKVACSAYPQAIAEVPDRIRRRISLFSYDDYEVKPSFLTKINNPDDAADQLATINWHIADGMPWNEVGEELARLHKLYPYSTFLSLYIFQVLSHADPNECSWLTAGLAQSIGDSMSRSQKFLDALSAQRPAEMKLRIREHTKKLFPVVFQDYKKTDGKNYWPDRHTHPVFLKIRRQLFYIWSDPEWIHSMPTEQTDLTNETSL